MCVRARVSVFVCVCNCVYIKMSVCITYSTDTQIHTHTHTATHTLHAEYKEPIFVGLVIWFLFFSPVFYYYYYFFRVLRQIRRNYTCIGMRSCVCVCTMGMCKSEWVWCTHMCAQNTNIKCQCVIVYARMERCWIYWRGLYKNVTPIGDSLFFFSLFLSFPLCALIFRHLCACVHVHSARTTHTHQQPGSSDGGSTAVNMSEVENMRKNNYIK